MKLHANIFHLLCDDNMTYYIEYINMLRSEIIEIMTKIRTFLENTHIISLRFNVHKLISMICYLENNDELLHLCKYLLHQSKKLDPGPEMQNYLYYTREIVNYNYRALL